MTDIGTYRFGEIEVDGKRYTRDIKIVTAVIDGTRPRPIKKSA